MTEESRPNIMPVVIGIGLTMVLLVGLALLARNRRNVEVNMAPALTIVEPGAGDTAAAPLAVRFASARPVELKPTGWGYGRLHLHADVNGVEIMPAAADIVAQDSTYVWRMPGVAAGAVTIQLGWADEMHRPLTAGQSGVISAWLADTASSAVTRSLQVPAPHH